jgi:glycosyltransferase involved in cell wall biosynthesis
MKIAYITAGAAGMFCGSCMRDNTLVTALRDQGHDAFLLPTYTPIRTDEIDVSERPLFFGGINVYLRSRSKFFRRLPRFFNRWLDSPTLLRWVSNVAMSTKAEELGDLTVSMLNGDHGEQRLEVERLATWLAEHHRPDVVNLTNVMLAGMVPELKRRLGVPVLITLQGDDIYLESLSEPSKGRSLALIRDLCREVDGFIATSTYFADFMAGYLQVPRERIHVVLPGINLAGHGDPRAMTDAPPYIIGYFARICPEKGLHHLVDAFKILTDQKGAPPCRLKVSGWLGPNNKAFLEEQVSKLRRWGLADRFEYVESPDHVSKVRFLQSIDVLSVPTVYREPKGLYILEALANGVPVVQPKHGSFPELIGATNGGVLVTPDEPKDLARGLRELLDNVALRREMGEKGREIVHRLFNMGVMAERTMAVYQTYVKS